MSWKDNLQNASYAGVSFDVESATDTVEHAISEHAYPFLNGVDAEDLGLRARKFSLKIIIWGDDYEQKLSDLIQVLDIDVPSELIHPVYGSVIDVLVATYTVSHSADNVDYCTIDADFVQSVTVTEFFKLEPPMQMFDLASMLQDLAQNSIIDGLLDILDTAKNVLEFAENIKKTALKYISSIKSFVRKFNVFADIIKFPKAFCADIASAARGIFDTRAFKSVSAKSDWSSIKADVQSVILFDDSKLDKNTKNNSSGTQNNSVKTTSKTDVKSPEYTQKLLATTAKVIVITELSKGFLDILKDEIKEPVLSPGQIEEIANDIREMFDDCIDAVGDVHDSVAAHSINETLKTAAHAITTASKKAIEVRPPLVTRIVESPANLHLLAFLWYRDYTRAQELVRLNPQIRNPNKINVGEIIYGYAK